MKISQKRIIFAGAIILFSALAYAANTFMFKCSACGFQTKDEVWEGTLMVGIYSIVYCPTCKQFHSILTFVGPMGASRGKKAVQSTGKEDFEGAKRSTYPCPKCGSKAYDYQGPLCPICRKGNLEKICTGGGNAD